MMGNIRGIIATFKLQMCQSFARPTFRFCILAQPIVVTFFLYMMYKQSDYINYVNYVVLGTGLCTLWSAICFSSAGDIQREAYGGTLENISSVPVPFYLIMLGKVLGNTFLGLLGMAISSISIWVFTGELMQIADIGQFSLAFMGMLLSFLAVSVVIAPIFTLSKQARVLMNCMESPIFILCGFVVPIEMLPIGVRWISYLLPPTWGTKILREVANGSISQEAYWQGMGILLLLSIFYILVSVVLFKQIDKKTRILATLGVS